MKRAVGLITMTLLAFTAGWQGGRAAGTDQWGQMVGYWLVAAVLIGVIVSRDREDQT